MRSLASIRTSLGSSVAATGEFSIFLWESVRALRRLWRRRGLFLRHCEFIGVGSIGIVGVAGAFMGAVLGYQLYVSFHYFGAEALLGGSVGVGLYRELAPVMAALMVTGRAGAAMAAEIATMKITEQLDALEVMAVDPVEFLVTPRILAGTLMMPVLSMFFCAIASLSAAGVSCGIMGLDYSTYWTQYAKMVDRIDVVHCMTKGAMFGLVLTTVGCFFGYRALGGARAVGVATRNTVVVTSLLILLTDYLLTSFLPFGFSELSAN